MLIKTERMLNLSVRMSNVTGQYTQHINSAPESCLVISSSFFILVFAGEAKAATIKIKASDRSPGFYIKQKSPGHRSFYFVDIFVY